LHETVGKDIEPYSHLALRPYPEKYVTPVQLKDSTALTFRPIKPEDEPLWIELLVSCSKESIYQRFRYFFQWALHEVATRYCFIDYDREIAIVAEIEENGRRKLLGVGRLVADPDHETVEYAVLITDAWQKKDQGLSQWKSYVPTYDLIDLDSVCTGVSVILSALEATFEKRFEVEAGSGTQALGIQVKSAKGLAVTTSSDLTIRTDAGLVLFIKPVAFQIDSGRMKYLDIVYVLSGDQYHFALGKRNPLLPTIIIARTQVIEPAGSLK